MGNVQDGTVYVSLIGDLFDEGNAGARWSGHCEFRDDSPIEFGPEFVDASDAVTWWRQRGAKRVFIRLDFLQYLWAGEGPAPDDGATLFVFDPADPRGRPEGAAKTLNGERRAIVDGEREERGAAALEEGRRLTRRREAVSLSRDELAARVNEPTQWLLDVESGRSSHDVTFAQWVNLVWATREGWPEERRPSDTKSTGWGARRGQLLREAEVFMNEALGLYE